jgi:hypothetical protein
MDDTSISELIQRALVLLNQLKRCAESEHIIAAIENCLIMTLNKVDPTSEPDSFQVKAEPEETPLIYYDGAEYQDNVSVDVKPELDSLEVMETEIKQEPYNIQVPMTDVFNLEMYHAKYMKSQEKNVKPSSKRKYEFKKRKKLDHDVLYDCPQCDLKNLTIKKLKAHKYNVHVSSFSRIKKFFGW